MLQSSRKWPVAIILTWVPDMLSLNYIQAVIYRTWNMKYIFPGWVLQQKKYVIGYLQATY